MSVCVLCIVHRNSAVSRASSSSAPAAPLRALASAVPKHLFKRQAAHRLPDVGEESALVRLGRRGIAAQRNLATFCIFHAAIAAVDFHRGANAGEHQVCAPDAFRLQPLNPIAYALRQFAKHLAPVADRSIFGTRAAD